MASPYPPFPTSQPTNPPPHARSESPLFEPMVIDMEHTSSNSRKSDSTTSAPANSPASSRQESPRVRPPRRAAARKSSPENASPINPITTTRYTRNTRRLAAENDPENQEIVRLRCEKMMSWGEIANTMNQHRRQEGKPDDFTPHSVYGRYVRNGPRIAIQHSLGFDPKDYMYLRNPHHQLPESFRVQPTQAWGTGASRKRVRGDGNEEQELKGNIRPKMAAGALQAALQTRAASQLLIQAVNNVNADYWVTVADELDRLGGKYYEPVACEKRYRELKPENQTPRAGDDDDDEEV